MGTSCNLTWRETGDSEIVWVIDPAHPITRGIDRYFRLEAEETYGEPFVIPNPDKVLLIGNYSGGEVFRSGVLYERGTEKSSTSNPVMRPARPSRFPKCRPLSKMQYDLLLLRTVSLLRVLTCERLRMMNPM
jgi:hypothetical protein